jgi:hypothetical protein
MQLKNLIILFLMLSGCTNEPDINKYEVFIRNNSMKTVYITTFFNHETIQSIKLEDGEIGIPCLYNNESFTGYQLTTCLIDSIVFRFNMTNKGYISSINNPSSFDFMNSENIFGPSAKFLLIDGRLEYVLTEADFNNAMDLP